VLRIEPGDRVVTSTADAGGADRTGGVVAPRGNPLTGPFYVEGAQPGDTLVVRLEHIYPNRPHGFTSRSIAPHLVDPDYVRELPPRATTPEAWRATWQVDLESGSATLEDDSLPAPLTVDLDPMLGCIGVAPPRGQAISTATSGPYGGNMHYRGFVPGVTAYFPVFEEGALLFVGDGHARQGDGEIVGTGIEISMDVAFTVELQTERRIGWPRGETETHIFTAGNARPLDQAVQHATTEMLRWLAEDYGLDSAAASHLMGQLVEYDVGNVFDPAYTMICKLAKAVLPERLAR
jgi:acetamidase/formamidase